MAESTGPEKGTAAGSKAKAAPSSNGHKKGSSREGVRITRKEDFAAFEVSFDEGAEVAVLCSIGIDPMSYDEVSKIVAPRNFYREKHQVIYRAMGDVRSRGDPPDFLIVLDELEAQGRLEAAGGIAEVAHIFNDAFVPDAGNARAYARIVLKHAIRRTKLRLAEVYGAQSQSEDPKWDHAAAVFGRELEDMARRYAGGTEAKERFRLMSDEEVERLAPPSWLVGGILPAGRLSVLFGEYSTYKSFLALDWALCIATGTSWNGHPVLQGPVVYIAGEGIGGMGQRIRAWKQRAGWSGPSGLHLIGEPPQLLSLDDVRDVRAVVRNMSDRPALVIIDTLARSMAGEDENAAEKMGLAVRHADLIRTEFDCHVLLVHHSPWNAQRTRGSTTLPGAADTLIDVSKGSDGVLKVTCRKQKDAEEFKPFDLRPQIVALDEEGRETSVVLGLAAASESAHSELLPSQRTALLALSAHPECTRSGLSSSEWERVSGQSHSTYQDARRWLDKVGIVSRLTSGNYILTPNGVRLVRSEYERGTTGPDQDSA